MVECKKFGEILSTRYANQLFRYFSVTSARIAILTNGCSYEFYTDLDAPNKMDKKPFLVLNMLDIDEHLVPELKKLTKTTFDIDSVLNAAGELKHLYQIKNLLSDQFKDADEDFVDFFTSRIYVGRKTSKVKSQFQELAKKALKQFLNDSINARLNSIIDREESAQLQTNEPADDDRSGNRKKIVTTQEEIDGYNIVRSILRTRFDVERIFYRDTGSYFGVLLDDSNRKPLCRLYLDTKQKYLVLIGVDKKEIRFPIDSVDDLFTHGDTLLEAASKYE